MNRFRPLPIVWVLAFLLAGWNTGGAAQGGRQNPPPAQPVVERQRALERMQASQGEIQRLSSDLKQALLELNRLRQVSPQDPNFKNVPAAIAAQNDKVLKLAAAVYGLIQGYGLADVIVNQRQMLAGLLANGLPASERQVLADAGFMAVDIAELSVAIQLRAADELPLPSPADVRKTLESAPKSMSPKSVLKIGAGALLIGVDVGSRFIPMLNAVTAFQVIGSVAQGMSLVGDGLSAAPAGR